MARGGEESGLLAPKARAGITAVVPTVLGLDSPSTLPTSAALAGLLSNPCLFFLHLYFQPQRSKDFVTFAFLPSSFLPFT